MKPSMDTRSGHTAHRRAIASVILFQSLLIIWLSSWVVGDYLNNVYVHAYVDDTFASLAWAFGALVLVGVLGSVLALVVHHRRGTLELVGASRNVPVSTPVKSRSLTPTPSKSTVPLSRPSMVPTQTVTTVTATGTTVSAPVTTAELHPAVAALKQELSDARMSLGLASVTTAGPQPTTSPATRFEDQRRPVPSQAQPHTITPHTLPPTVIRPASSSTSNQNVLPSGLTIHPPIPPTVIRPVMPVGPNPPSTPSHISQQPAAPQPVGVVPRQDVGPQTPRDMTTVITGIMPVLNKKKDEASSTERSNEKK